VIPDDLRAAVEAFVAHDRVLVATDFDGVVAPLVLDPSTSRPLPGTMEALRRLAALPDTYAAVVSGRDLATLTELTGLADSDVTRIGSHGGESSAADQQAPELTGTQREHLARLVSEMEELCASLPDGVYLEPKPAAVVLHTRRMDDDDARAAEEAALDVASRHEHLTVLHGKQVVEMSVVEADKGSALEALRDSVGARHVAYLGDDVTDEHAFECLSGDDLTIKVGAGDTAATFRVDRPQDAAEVIALLAELRAAATGNQRVDEAPVDRRLGETPVG
jgi:trehalose 6-phosphate phosphatase